MKRIVSLHLIILISVSLFSNNIQKIYTIRDDIYERVEELCSRAGVIGPSTFSPMPARALQIALDRITPESLSENDKKEYERLYTEITEDYYLFDSKGFGVSPTALINLSFNIANYFDFIYANSTSETPQTDRRKNTLIPYRYEDPSLSLGARIKFSDYIYLEGKIDIKNRNQRMLESSFGWLLTVQHEKKIFSGIPGEWPYRAGGSFGNDYINFIIGRFPHSMGNGITGNLIIGDNFNYQEIAALSFMSNYFTYNISLTRFDVQEKVKGEDYITKFSRNKFSSNQYRVVHRFDVNILNKARIVLNLATIFSSSSVFDLRFFSPFYINHNYYNYTNDLNLTKFDEANNLLSIEAEWNIVKGLNIYAELAVDQMQMPWEDSSSIPPAYGFVTNIKHNVRVFNGTLSSHFEAAFTNPYLYLNGKRDSSDDDEIEYNLDYVVGYSAHYLDEYGYSGYIYGPDTIAFSLGSDYKDEKYDYEIRLNILYKISGEKGLKHKSNELYDTIIDMGDAVIENDSSIFLNAKTPTGGWKSAEHLIKLALYGNYKYSATWGTVTVYSAFGFNNYFNYNHEIGNTEFQAQFLIGAKYAY